MPARRCPDGGGPADLDEVEAECFDLSQYAVERRSIQEAGEHGVGAVMLRRYHWESGQHRDAEVAGIRIAYRTVLGP